MAACSADGAPALQSLAESPPVRQRWPAALADSKRGGQLRSSVKSQNAGSGRNQAELLRTLSPWLFAFDSKLPGRRAGCSGKRPLPPTATCSKSLGSPRPAMRRGSNLLGKEIL